MTRDFQRPGRSAVYAREAMAATSHPLATEIAVSTMRAGGNAVDAALAAVFTLGVVEPAMVGIGGDLFALVAEPDGTIHGLNASGRAGRRADAGLLRDAGLTTIAETSAHSVTAPGMVAGAEALASRFGRFGLDQAVSRAAGLARDGFPVAPRVAWDWGRNVEKLRGDPGAREHLLVDGKAPKTGHVMRFPALARTLDAIGRDGVAAFYRGAVAEDIADTVGRAGGVLDADDLAAERPDWVPPVSRPYRDVELVELPPNGQGVFALLQLGIYEHFPVASGGSLSAERLHLVVEAARAAYAFRDHALADADHLTHAPADLFSDATAAHLAGQIDPDRRNPGFGLPRPQVSDTVILSTVDRDGMVCALIASLFAGFGSGLVAPRSGVVLHNRGSHFSLAKGHANEYGAAKRPRHTIIPALVRQGGQVVAGFGVMGGDYQATGHATVLSNIVDFGMDPQEAIDAPRVFFDADGAALVETGVSAEAVAGLERRGHRIARAEVPIGGGQMVWIDRARGVLVGASDPRKDGSALGY